MGEPVRVRLYASVRERAGRDAVELDLPGGSDVAAVREALGGACPAIRDQLAFCRFAVDDDFATDDARVAAGAVVDVIPPVSGG